MIATQFLLAPRFTPQFAPEFTLQLTSIALLILKWPLSKIFNDLIQMAPSYIKLIEFNQGISRSFDMTKNPLNYHH